MDINIEQFRTAGIDYDDGMAHCLNDSGLYLRVLCKFPNDPNYGELVSALDAGDISRAFAAAHTIKGVAGNLGLTELCAHDTELTEALRGEGNLAQARELLPSVTDAYIKAVEFIKTI